MTVWVLVGYDRFEAAHVIGVYATKQAADIAYGEQEHNYQSIDIVEEEVQ